MDFVFGIIAFLFLGKTVLTLVHSKRVQRLPRLAELAGQGTSRQSDVRCSVVVAARNEAARVEKTIRRLLDQCGIELEVIAVDDRSTDETTEVLRRMASLDSRLRVVRVDELPEGWLGKCHACHLGAGVATGDWILFTDADCWLKPDVIARTLAVAVRENVEHITLTAGVAPETLGGQAWHLVFLLSLSNWFANVNLDKPNSYLGMGAFNLVRADIYRRCGGYAALRLTVVDDVKLGLLIRRAGGKTRGFVGGDDAECHWGATARSMIKIMEKNYFAILEYRTFVALVLVFGGAALWMLAVIGPFTGRWSGVAAGLALLSLAAPAALFARRLGWKFGGAFLAPFIFPVILYGVWNSLVVTLRQGGVRWRETFYSLETLRKGTLR